MLLSCISFFSCSAKSLLACTVSSVCSSSKFDSPLGASTPMKYLNSDCFSSANLSAKRCRSFFTLTMPRGSFSIWVCLMSRVWRLKSFSMDSGSDLTLVRLNPIYRRLKRLPINAGTSVISESCSSRTVK
uniref:MRPR1 n=1 Tax=Arundo donax TaxID=35708 RepID=A0A0A9BTM4_ARUDO